MFRYHIYDVWHVFGRLPFYYRLCHASSSSYVWSILGNLGESYDPLFETISQENVHKKPTAKAFMCPTHCQNHAKNPFWGVNFSINLQVDWTLIINIYIYIHVFEFMIHVYKYDIYLHMYRYTYVVRVWRVTATVFSGHVKLFSSIQSSIPLQLDHGLFQQTSSNFCSISCYMSSFVINCYIDTENPRDVFPKCPVFEAKHRVTLPNCLGPQKTGSRSVILRMKS